MNMFNRFQINYKFKENYEVPNHAKISVKFWLIYSTSSPTKIILHNAQRRRRRYIILAKRCRVTRNMAADDTERNTVVLASTVMTYTFKI